MMAYIHQWSKVDLLLILVDGRCLSRGRGVSIANDSVALGNVNANTGLVPDDLEVSTW